MEYALPRYKDAANATEPAASYDPQMSFMLHTSAFNNTWTIRTFFHNS